ncbi:MAG: hypothetical protein NC419_08955 [Muribaculaceae bacterium]|nr:hypothetical protein [Muribaculaceae bacterium]
MGMRIGTVNSNRTLITLKNKDGTTMGTISISKATKKKKKKLSYNFKRVSTQILAAKTSSNAGKAVRQARGQLVLLLMKQKSGDYDEKAVSDAITHAREMERTAKKRKKHMEEEERAEQSGSCFAEDEAEVSGQEEQEESQEIEESAKELEELEKELEQLLKESAEDMNDLTEELVSASWEDMDPEALDNLKRKHRAEELRDIMEADMKYLKALFDRLTKEKQANASQSVAANAESGVSLQLAGVEMPVEATEAPVSAEGGAVDVSV